MNGLYCNNENCRNYQEGQTCTATEVYYVDRLCVTFRRRRTEPDYASMMQVQLPGCHREQGKYVSDHVVKVLR